MCADHWDRFTHAHLRDQTVYDDGLMAKRLACGSPDTMGSLAERCLYCGQGTCRVAMRGPSSLCLQCATVSVATWVSQVRQRLHAGVLERHIILTVPGHVPHAL